MSNEKAKVFLACTAAALPAIIKEARRQGVNRNLYRLAYNDFFVAQALRAAATIPPELDGASAARLYVGYVRCVVLGEQAPPGAWWNAGDPDVTDTTLIEGEQFLWLIENLSRLGIESGELSCDQVLDINDRAHDILADRSRLLHEAWLEKAWEVLAPHVDRSMTPYPEELACI